MVDDLLKPALEDVQKRIVAQRRWFYRGLCCTGMSGGVVVSTRQTTYT